MSLRSFGFGVLWVVLAGCGGETKPEIWMGRRGSAVFGVWDCDRPRVAERLLKRWATVSPPPEVPSTPEHQTSYLSSLLPPDNVVPGWERVAKPVDVEGDALERYLRRTPVEFEAFGVQRLIAAEYRFPRLGPWAQLVIEIYDMGTPENAFGIYSQKRIPGGLFRTMGVESFVGNTEVLGWADRYFFSLKAYHFADEPRDAIRAFAKWIAHRIRTNAGEPPLIRAYADPLLVERSQRWFRTLSQAQLAGRNANLLLFPLSERTRGFTVRVKTNEAETAEGFCILFSSEEEATTAVETIRSALRHSGYTLRAVTTGNEAFRAALP